MAQKKTYWRMGVRYAGNRAVDWGQKRFATAAELNKAVAAWMKKNEDVLAEVHYRREYYYEFAEENPAK